MISEVNAVSEELNKYRHFELVSVFNLFRHLLLKILSYLTVLMTKQFRKRFDHYLLFCYSQKIKVLLGAATQDDNQTKVMVQVKDLASGNLWLWERGKFMNRRYIMQEMYQQFIDDDQSWKDIKKEDVSNIFI